jgi:hypothetical protein
MRRGTLPVYDPGANSHCAQRSILPKTAEPQRRALAPTRQFGFRNAARLVAQTERLDRPDHSPGQRKPTTSQVRQRCCSVADAQRARGGQQAAKHRGQAIRRRRCRKIALLALAKSRRGVSALGKLHRNPSEIERYQLTASLEQMENSLAFADPSTPSNCSTILSDIAIFHWSSR